MTEPIEWEGEHTREGLEAARARAAWPYNPDQLYRSRVARLTAWHRAPLTPSALVLREQMLVAEAAVLRHAYAHGWTYDETMRALHGLLADRLAHAAEALPAGAAAAACPGCGRPLAPRPPVLRRAWQRVQDWLTVVLIDWGGRP